MFEKSQGDGERQGNLDLILGLGKSPGEGKGYPTPVFWPGEFHGLYSPWGRKELDRTEQLSLSSCPWGFALAMKGRGMLSPELSGDAVNERGPWAVTSGQEGDN